jgi:integrase
VLERRLTVRRENCPLVFYYRNGLPVGDWRKTWAKATKAAKLPGKLIHDCRRTAARNLVRSGVPERVAMTLLGHRTKNVFDRYNIVSEGDLRQATDRLARYLASQPTKAGEAPAVSLPTETRQEPAQTPHTGTRKGEETAADC